MVSRGTNCHELSKVPDLPKEIEWTSESVKDFKKVYAQSQKRKASQRQDMFVWKGYQFIPGYARYLIEYLDSLSDEGANI